MDYYDPDLISAIARRRQSDGNQPAAAAAMVPPAPAQASYSLNTQLLATAIGTVSPGAGEHPHVAWLEAVISQRTCAHG